MEAKQKPECKCNLGKPGPNLALGDCPRHPDQEIIREFPESAGVSKEVAALAALPVMTLEEFAAATRSPEQTARRILAKLGPNPMESDSTVEERVQKSLAGMIAKGGR